jgi:hypothetical protein
MTRNTYLPYPHRPPYQPDEPGSREPPRVMIRESRVQQVQHVVQQQRVSQARIGVWRARIRV